MVFVNIREINKSSDSKINRKGVNYQNPTKVLFKNENYLVTVRWMLGAQLFPANWSSRKCVGNVPARKVNVRRKISGPRPFRPSKVNETMPGF